MATIKREFTDTTLVEHSANNGHHLTVWDLREFARACAEAGIGDKEKATIAHSRDTQHATRLYVRTYRDLDPPEVEPKVEPKVEQGRLGGDQDA